MKLFSSLFIVAIVSFFTLAGANTASAGSFDGTFEGRAKMLLNGKVTNVDVTLTVLGTEVDLVVTDGTTTLNLDVTAFVDNRGVFFGVLGNETGIVAGFGGRINGKSKKSHIVGRFLQEDYSKPFHLKRVVLE